MSDKILICHAAELDALLCRIAHGSDEIDVWLVDGDGSELRTRSSVTPRVIRIPLLMSTIRPSLLKNAYHVFSWLLSQRAYTNIFISNYSGLAFFVLSHRNTSNDFKHLRITLLTGRSITDDFSQNREFKDRQAAQLSYLERRCIELSQQHLPDPQSTVAEVSIVITHFNRSDTLLQALRSVHQQSIRVTEVIVVDDASSEAQFHQVLLMKDNLEKEGLPVTVVRNECNSGPSVSRNTALNIINSEFVLFLDDDDVLTNDAVERLMFAQRKSGADFVTCSYNFFYSDSYPDTALTPADIIVFAGAGDWISGLFYNCVGGITALYRKSILVGSHVFSNSRDCGEEDWQLILKLLNAGYKNVYCPPVLLWYRNSANSISDTFDHYSTRHNLFNFYQGILPAQFAELPEIITSMELQLADKSVLTQGQFAKLGFHLAKYRDLPIYIYGAGKIGIKVYQVIQQLGLADKLICFFDRNAKHMPEIAGKLICDINESDIPEASVIIIASMSFIDEIEQSIEHRAQYIVRLD